MSFLQELRLAACLDRLIGSLKLTPPPADPMMEACRQLEQGVWEQFAQVNADERFRTRRLAQLRERERPGYTAALNRQRALVGLPPI